MNNNENNNIFFGNDMPNNDLNTNNLQQNDAINNANISVEPQVVPSIDNNVNQTNQEQTQVVPNADSINPMAQGQSDVVSQSFDNLNINQQNGNQINDLLNPQPEMVNQGVMTNSVDNNHNVVSQNNFNGIENQDNSINMMQSQQPNQQNSITNNNTGLTETTTVASGIVNNPKKISKKILFAIIGIVALVVVGIVIFLPFGNKNGLYKNEVEALNIMFDPKNPIKIKKNDKYGYITSDGETLLAPKYDYASDFYGDYAIVGILENGSDYEYSSYEVIDKKGNVKIESEYSDINYYPEYGIWLVDGVMYDSKFKRKYDESVMHSYIDDGYFSYMNPVKEESGIITYKGKKVFSWEGSELGAEISKNYYDENDVYAEVTNYDDREVIVSFKTGKILYTLDDAERYNITSETNGVFYVYDTDYVQYDKWLYFKDGKLLYESTDEIEDVTVYDYENAILELNYGYDNNTYETNYKYYDAKNGKMLSSKPSSTSNNDYEDIENKLQETLYGYRIYECSSRYGLISGEDIAIKCGYDEIDFVNLNLFNYMRNKKKQDLFLLEKDDKAVLMDVKNTVEIIKFDSGYVYTENSTFVKNIKYDYSNYDSKTIYIIYNLLTGKSMKFSDGESISLYSNYITVSDGDNRVYYNTDFKKIYTEKLENY